MWQCHLDESLQVLYLIERLTVAWGNGIVLPAYTQFIQSNYNCDFDVIK